MKTILDLEKPLCTRAGLKASPIKEADPTRNRNRILVSVTTLEGEQMVYPVAKDGTFAPELGIQSAWDIVYADSLKTKEPTVDWEKPIVAVVKGDKNYPAKKICQTGDGEYIVGIKGLHNQIGSFYIVDKDGKAGEDMQIRNCT